MVRTAAFQALWVAPGLGVAQTKTENLANGYIIETFEDDNLPNRAAGETSPKRTMGDHYDLKLVDMDMESGPEGTGRRCRVAHATRGMWRRCSVGGTTRKPGPKKTPSGSGQVSFSQSKQ